MTLEAALERGKESPEEYKKHSDGGDGAARPGMLDLQNWAR